MKRYEAYKPVTSRWAKQLPFYWEFQKIAEVFIERKENNDPIKTTNILSLTNTRGVIPYSDKGNLGNKAKNDIRGYRLAYPGDIVLNSMNVVIGSVGLSQYYGAVSPVYYMLYVRNNTKYNVRYYNYVFQDKIFQGGLNGLGNGILEIRMRIPMSKLKYVCVPVPPRDEQDQIVRYLDWQVSKINRLIAAKRKQIELLSEEKQNIINAAVLHGVNDRCEKRTSPILFADWIPSHWRVLRGKYLFAEHDRRTETGNEVLLSVSHITGVTPRSEKNITMFQAESLVGYKICSVDDIAANTMWMWQGAIAVSDYYGVISPSYNTYHQIGNHYNRKYLDYLLRSNVMVNEYKAKSTGIRKSRLRLYPEQFLSMSFPIPPMDEQLEIVKYIEAKIQRIEVMVSTIHAEIQKIQDLRARLISDVVTGQIDVRGIEVPTFEYIDESNNNDENTEEMEAELDG